MPETIRYRFVGARDANGVAVLYLSGVPAQDITASEAAAMDEEMLAVIEASPLYETLPGSGPRRDLAEPVDPNVPSPGMPEEQRSQVAPPGSDAAGPTGEVSAGPPTDAQAQEERERRAAQDNPALSENPPVVRRGRRG
jgi:hypothetical protein